MFIADMAWRGLSIELAEDTGFRIWYSLEIENAIDLKKTVMSGSARRHMRDIWTNKIRDGYEKVIEDTFTQKGLNKTATWTSVATTDVKGFANSHEGNNRVEPKRRNLRCVVSGEKGFS